MCWPTKLIIRCDIEDQLVDEYMAAGQDEEKKQAALEKWVDALFEEISRYDKLTNEEKIHRMQNASSWTRTFLQEGIYRPRRLCGYRLESVSFEESWEAMRRVQILVNEGLKKNKHEQIRI